MRIKEESLKDGDIIWITRFSWNENSYPNIISRIPIKCKIKLKRYREYDQCTDTLSDYEIDYTDSECFDPTTDELIDNLSWHSIFSTEIEAIEYYNSCISSDLKRVSKQIEKYKNVGEAIENMRII